MDYLLAVTTVLVNGNLGWSRGNKMSWILHILNNILWIFYGISITQYGLIILSVVSILIDSVSLYKRCKNDKQEISEYLKLSSDENC